jgi:hypothetical protein
MGMLMIAAVSAVWAAAELDPTLVFERERIGEGTYEACSIVDLDNDGYMDIVHGEYWFAGPDFETRHKIADIDANQDYFDDFSDYPLDVDGDGYADIVTGAWWGQSVRWRENPDGKTIEWETHEVAKVGNVERPSFWDIDGDGHVEVVPNTPGNVQQIFKLKRDADGKGTGEFIQHTISQIPTGHGLGFGDIDGDGKGDLIVHNGWFKQPANPMEDEWPFQEDFKLYDSASVPILVHDVDGDGDNDIIVGAGHDYGLAWWEQVKDGDTTTWTKHDIETDRSQFHEMQLVDIDNDGELELVTGKRWRAHMGNDPGADDPLGLYYYEINGGDFGRVTIDYGPADQASGTGIYMWITDLTGNGYLDILAPGKEGLYLFRNQGPKK